MYISTTHYVALINISVALINISRALINISVALINISVALINIIGNFLQLWSALGYSARSAVQVKGTW